MPFVSTVKPRGLFRHWTMVNTDSCIIITLMFLIQRAPLKIKLVLWQRSYSTYMYLVDWEVRAGKNCDRGLENAVFRHGFPLYRPTLNQSVTCLSFVLLLAHKWVCLHNIVIVIALHRTSLKYSNDQIGKLELATVKWFPFKIDSVSYYLNHTERETQDYAPLLHQATNSQTSELQKT